MSEEESTQGVARWRPGFRRARLASDKMSFGLMAGVMEPGRVAVTAAGGCVRTVFLGGRGGRS